MNVVTARDAALLGWMDGMGCKTKKDANEEFYNSSDGINTHVGMGTLFMVCSRCKELIRALVVFCFRRVEARWQE
jgi:hypothetical protein